MGELGSFILFFGDDEEEQKKADQKSDKVDKGQVDYMRLKS